MQLCMHLWHVCCYIGGAVNIYINKADKWLTWWTVRKDRKNGQSRKNNNNSTEEEMAANALDNNLNSIEIYGAINVKIHILTYFVFKRLLFAYVSAIFNSL